MTRLEADPSLTAPGDRALPIAAGRFAAFAAVLTVGFCLPLWGLLRFSFQSDFFSYIPLVPFISAYLIGVNRSRLPRTVSTNWLGVVVSSGAGIIFLALEAWLGRSAGGLETSTYLALLTASYLCLLLAGAFYFLGAEFIRALGFPILFLVFFIPPPMFLLNPTVGFFQHASAWTAVAMIKSVGTPVFAEGLNLQLPGMALRVAPECSGIHSTMVLLMTSLLAGNMFLKSNGSRLVLALFVVPLAIMRNGFRIFVIGELCVHVGPQMIDSPIHHHGGPIFFALSLVPFFALLLYLRKREAPLRRSATAAK